MTEDGIRLESVQRNYDWEETTPTFAIIESISAFEFGNPNRVPEVLDAPLNDYIDADGIDKVVRSTGSVTIDFTVSTYDIQISGNTVRVRSEDSN